LLTDLFEAEEGYEVCAEAIDGQGAIALAIKHRPDLIILDLSMPVMNGVEASPELKQIMPDVPIILSTHHASLSNSLFGSGAS
jgi:DNA-binding NarL/FixJ family response regulator